jgi:hypothetical protein
MRRVVITQDSKEESGRWLRGSPRIHGELLKIDLEFAREASVARARRGASALDGQTGEYEERLPDAEHVEATRASKTVWPTERAGCRRPSIPVRQAGPIAQQSREWRRGIS